MGGDDVQPVGESAASEETENDSSAAGIEEEAKALDSVTIVPVAEPETGTQPPSALDTTEESESIKTLSDDGEQVQVIETEAEAEAVEEAIGSDAELQNVSGSETEAAPAEVTDVAPKRRK